MPDTNSRAALSRSVYGAAASTLLRVSGVDISLTVFLIHFYICVKKQVGRDYIQQFKERKCYYFTSNISNTFLYLCKEASR